MSNEGIIRGRFRGTVGKFDLDASFEAPAPGLTALFGPSGCGKTTVLRAAAGLLRLADGYFSIGDEVWQDASTFRPPHRRAIGFVFQEASLFAHMGTSNNDNFFVELIAGASATVILAHNLCEYAVFGAGRRPLGTRRAHYSPMRQPSVPASPAGGCCRQGSAGRFWLSPARCRSSVRSGHPASSVEHRTRARCGLELGSFGGSRSPAPGIADDCDSRDDESGCAIRASWSFASVSAE